MPNPLVLLSIPALRETDVAAMRHLRSMTAGGEIVELVPSFPCVTCPVQAAMTTGCGPSEHGVVGNGFFDRAHRRVLMWTAPNECIDRPQIWDFLSHQPRGYRSAVWFPLHSQGCEADFVCTPAPIHNPDGSESLWCYTRPVELYGELRDRLGHFPLMSYWGPRAGVEASRWIVDSAVLAARRWQPDFFYIYLPHLDYAAQRSGPDSPEAAAAVAELDEVLGRLSEGITEAYDETPLWLAAGEYAITPVRHVCYPNRVLREAGLLAVCASDDGEQVDLEHSRAFAMVDHQFSHVYLADDDPQLVRRVVDLFRSCEGIGEVLAGAQRSRYGMEHARSGEVIVISAPHSWQAYYWWLSDDRAPRFARTVDIHRKPGYDPVELFLDPAMQSIPLDAGLVRGSHGAPAVDPSQRTVLVASEPLRFSGPTVKDTDVFGAVLSHFDFR
ncbi:MAG: alkaline phosphatase family protein [Planctomycetaceae bacterium]|nr:alkaline phosphatase family protein [Planctomycetaceae bacterium]